MKIYIKANNNLKVPVPNLNYIIILPISIVIKIKLVIVLDYQIIFSSRKTSNWRKLLEIIFSIIIIVVVIIARLCILIGLIIALNRRRYFVKEIINRIEVSSQLIHY